MQFLDTFYKIMTNVDILWVGSWIGLPLSLFLIIYFCMKSNRDERGWKIMGKASVISFITLFVLANAVARLGGRLEMNDYEINYLFWGSSIQWIYNIVLFVESAAILIFRKIE